MVYGFISQPSVLHRELTDQSFSVVHPPLHCLVLERLPIPPLLILRRYSQKYTEGYATKTLAKFGTYIVPIRLAS